MAVVPNLFVCTPAQVAQHSFWEMYHSEKEGTAQCWEICFTVQLVALEQLQSSRSLAQTLQTVQVPDPDEGLDPVTPVPGMGNPCYSHAVSPTLSVEGKKLTEDGRRVQVLTSCYDLFPHFAVLHSAGSGIQNC